MAAVAAHSALAVGSTGASTMRAAVLTAPRRLEVRQVARPRPETGEVLLRVSAVGLCGTDLHIYSGDANYHRDRDGRPVPLEVTPQILGHEIVGTVAEVGASVVDVAVGDLVVVDQGRTCVAARREPRCEYCRSGDSHQCEHYSEHGITGLPGGFAEFLAVPAVNAVPVRSALDPAHAALTEPLACVLHAMDVLRRAPARYQLDTHDDERRVRTIVVCGAGPAGLLLIQCLRRVVRFGGAIIVIEPNATRRALAQRFGADTIDPRSVDAPTAVRERSAGRMAELLVEASGAGAVFLVIPRLVRKQATVVLYGHGHGGVGLDALNGVQFMEPTLLAPTGASGPFTSDDRPAAYVQALRLIEEGVIDVASLITHRYPTLEALTHAFDRDHLTPGYVKGVLTL